jgi:hypothetical protein
MKIRTSELIGPALDLAVAMCEGYTEYDPETDKLLPPRKEYGWVFMYDLNYSTDWAQGGPIIEREGIGIWPSEREGNKGQWGARMLNTHIAYGPTPLIAAMRCYVASKMGDEVEVPDGLVNKKEITT